MTDREYEIWKEKRRTQKYVIITTFTIAMLAVIGFGMHSCSECQAQQDEKYKAWQVEYDECIKNITTYENCTLVFNILGYETRDGINSFIANGDLHGIFLRGGREGGKIDANYNAQGNTYDCIKVYSEYKSGNDSKASRMCLDGKRIINIPINKIRFEAGTEPMMKISFDYTIIKTDNGYISGCGCGGNGCGNTQTTQKSEKNEFRSEPMYDEFVVDDPKIKAFNDKYGGITQSISVVIVLPEETMNFDNNIH